MLRIYRQQRCALIIHRPVPDITPRKPSTKHPFALTVQTEARTFYLVADSDPERAAWADALTIAVKRATANTAEILESAAGPVTTPRTSGAAEAAGAAKAAAAKARAAAQFCGFLTKSPTITKVDEVTHKRWQRRWFELHGSLLSYYVDEEKEGGERGQIELADTRRLYLEQVGHSYTHLPRVAFGAKSARSVCACACMCVRACDGGGAGGGGGIVFLRHKLRPLNNRITLPLCSHRVSTSLRLQSRRNRGRIF